MNIPSGDGTSLTAVSRSQFGAQFQNFELKDARHKMRCLIDGCDVPRN